MNSASRTRSDVGRVPRPRGAIEPPTPELTRDHAHGKGGSVAQRDHGVSSRLASRFSFAQNDLAASHHVGSKRRARLTAGPRPRSPAAPGERERARAPVGARETPASRTVAHRGRLRSVHLELTAGSPCESSVMVIFPAARRRGFARRRARSAALPAGARSAEASCRRRAGTPPTARRRARLCSRLEPHHLLRLRAGPIRRRRRRSAMPLAGRAGSRAASRSGGSSANRPRHDRGRASHTDRSASA